MTDAPPPPMRPVRIDRRSVCIRTPAKLNLFLEVTGKRPDGYHDLDMLLEAVDLCDTLTAARTDGGITLETDAPGIPTDRRNIVIRAAELFTAAAGIDAGVHFRLHKRIPPGGGLGGGSGNGVGALFALQELFGVPLEPARLHGLACALGSDVPYFLHGGLARCRGRGEIVDGLGSGSPRRFLLLIPSFALSTADVYAALIFPLTCPRSLGTMTVGSLEERLRAGEFFFNRLQEPAERLRPELGAIMRQARSAGLRAAMTGSGSCLFALLPEGFSAAQRGALDDRLAGAARVVEVSNLPPWG